MRFLNYLFILSIVFGCKSKINELNIIEIDATKTGEYTLSEIADSVIAVSLETNKKCLLSFVRKVKFSNKYIYVADKLCLYKFDYNGNFVNQINKVGRGPGEVFSFTDFFIEPTTGFVDIISYNKLQRFNNNDSLIAEIPLQQIVRGFPEQVHKIDTSFWINTIFFNVMKNGEKAYNISKLFRLNRKLIPVDSMVIRDIESKLGFAYINPGAVFHSSTKEYSYFYYPSHLIEPIIRDTLFQFENNKLVPVYKFNYGDKLNNIIRTQKEEKNNLPYKKFRINSIFITSYFLFSSYSIEDGEYFICCDTKNDRIYNMENGFIDDFFDTGKVTLNHFNFPTDKMFFIKNGYEVAEKINGIDENSNPVIFIVKLKNIR